VPERKKRKAMLSEHCNTESESKRNVVLLIESAGDIVVDLRQLSGSLDQLLERCADLDEVINLLHEKKAKVDTLRELARQIKVQLRVDADGRIGVELPEGVRNRFIRLMDDLRRLLEDESRLESLICGRGLTVSRGGRSR
jgi:hypothetical protein